MEQVKYRYRTLEDFLISNPLSVDGQLDDGWGAVFPDYFSCRTMERLFI